MIENPKIGQEVWFAEACNQRIHSAKLIALDEVEVSTRKYLYAKIEMDDGCRLGWPLKNLYASREELQKELEKKRRKEVITMINNPKIGQKVWFLEPWGQCIHSAKITALGETEVSVRDPKKYPYADIEWDDGGNSGCLLKNLYASCEELQKELKKEEEKKIAEIKAKIKDTGDLVAFMYDHCVACAEEYTDWTARRAVKEIAKEMLGLEL